MKTEFFRHIRPVYFDKQRMELMKETNGGFSFLIRALPEDQYAFWVYVCPQSIPFSSKPAIKALRERVSNGIEPFGTFKIDQGIIPSLSQAAISRSKALGLEFGHYLERIVNNNQRASHQFTQAIAQQSAREIYLNL
jgi:hypothetical protein